MGDDRLDSLDYYELLEVSEHATNDEIRRAFHAFALRYHPDRLVGEASDRRERAAEIYRRGSEAYRVLCDAALRRAYDEQRARGKRRFDPDDAPPSAGGAGGEGPATQSVPIRNARARPFVQKASEAMKKGDWATAKLNLKLALQHEPGHPVLEARLVEVERQIASKK